MATNFMAFFLFHKNKLFNGKRILRFVAAPFVFIFVVLSSLIALFAAPCLRRPQGLISNIEIENLRSAGCVCYTHLTVSEQ